MLMGREAKDKHGEPQKNHLLVCGGRGERAGLADDPQALINATREGGGLAFLAHPDDPAAPAFHETDISWVDWAVENYTGIELWNHLSEFKTRLPTRLHGLFYAYFPSLVAHGPLKETIRRWDALLAHRKVVAIGGSHW